MNLQEVRQQDNIDRIIGDTEAIGRSDEFNVLSGLIVSDRSSPGSGNIAKGLATPASELKKLIAKYAAQSRANTPALFPQQGPSGTRFEPVRPGNHDLQLPASAHYDWAIITNTSAEGRTRSTHRLSCRCSNSPARGDFALPNGVQCSPLIRPRYTYGILAG